MVYRSLFSNEWDQEGTAKITELKRLIALYIGETIPLERSSLHIRQTQHQQKTVKKSVYRVVIFIYVL